MLDSGGGGGGGASWATILGVSGPPIKGEPSEFRTARDAFDTMYTHADSVQTTFKTITSEGVPEDRLNNQPAQTLLTAVEGVDKGLDDLPRIAREARDIFADHIPKLEDLRDRADEALGRAQTAWSNKQTAQSTIDNAGDDDDTEDAEGDLDSAVGALSSAREEYWELVGEEADLNEGTVNALDSIDRGNLDDPNWLEEVVSAVTNFVGGILENIAMLVEGLLTGDLGKILWALSGLLDAALLILGTLALLIPGLGVAIFAIALAGLALKATLAMTQLPNPQTGKVMSWGDVALSSVDVGLALIPGAGGALRGVMGGLRATRGMTGAARVTRVTSQSTRGFRTAMRTSLPGDAAIPSMINNVANMRNIARHGFRSPAGMRSMDELASLNWSGLNPNTAPASMRRLMYADVAINQTVAARGLLGQGQMWSDTSFGPVGDNITGGGDLEKVATTGETDNHNESGGPTDNINLDFLTNPMPNPKMAEQVVQQTVNQPNAHIVYA